MVKKTLAALGLVFLFGGSAGAVDFKNLDPNFGVYMLYENVDNDLEVATSAVMANKSTHTVYGYLREWNIQTVGGSVTFELRHTTGAIVSTAGGKATQSYLLNVSSSITVLANESMSDKMDEIVANPTIVLRTMEAGTTAYVRMKYTATRQ